MFSRRSLPRNRKLHSSLRLPRSLAVLVAALALLAVCCPATSFEASAEAQETTASKPAVLRATDPVFPAHFGTVQKRYDGKPGRPFVFVIGESHVRLEVQEAVADTLAYLHRTFDVDVIGSEGFSGPLPLPPRIGSQASRYETAWTAFHDRREINAVEYVALTVPGVTVYGVSDLAAYRKHGEYLEKLQRRREDWAERFTAFMREKVANLRVSQKEGARLVEAFKAASESGKFKHFGEVLCEIEGRSSEVCQGFAKLLAEDAELDRAEKSSTVPDNPLEKDRDRALVANTLALAGTGRVALVVGYLHVPGVEKNLQAAGASFLVIVPPGVKEDVDNPSPMSPEDLEVWNRWRKGTPTKFEAWLDENLRSRSHLKPPPSLERESAQNMDAILNALDFADHQLTRGLPVKTVLGLLRSSKLPRGFQVVGFYWSGTVRWIEFKAGGRTGYAAFADGSSPGSPPPGMRKVMSDMMPDGRRYVVYDGGSGEPPREPPGTTTPPPGDDPFGNFRAVFERQQRENPNTLTIAFQVFGGHLYRFVNGRPRCLAASPTLIADVRRRLDEETSGPEHLEAAQQLADWLLMDIDDDLPREFGPVLYEVSDDDILGSYSLPFLARLAADPSAGRLRSIRAVYAVPWTKDVEAILSEPAPTVDVKKTVFWLSSHLVEEPRYSQVVGAIEAAGARVNTVPEKGDTLVLVGDPKRAWVVDLRGGQQRRADTADFRADLTRASAIVAIGVGLSKKDLEDARSLHRIDASAGQALELGKKTVEAISKASGKETLDRAVREISAEETVELRDLLGKEDSQGFANSLAATGEHATLLSRI